jgi:hypothetical protein
MVGVETVARRRWRAGASPKQGGRGRCSVLKKYCPKIRVSDNLGSVYPMYPTKYTNFSSNLYIFHRHLCSMIINRESLVRHEHNGVV